MGGEGSPSMQARTLVLVGKTGNGKSATGNSVLGVKAFKALNSCSSVTSICNLQTATLANSRFVSVIDTPGTCDTNRSSESIEEEVRNCLVLAPGGVHALVLVLSGRTWCTEDELRAAESLNAIFGEKVTDYMVVVFTGGDHLDDGQTLDQYLDGAPPFLHDFLRRCGHRKLSFDNKTADSTKQDAQRNELLRVIDDLVTKNGGVPYTSQHLKEAQDIMLKTEEEEKRCIEEDLKQEELKREMEIKAKVALQLEQEQHSRQQEKEHALKLEQENSKVQREKYEQEMFKKIEKLNKANARKNGDTIKKRLDSSAKAMADSNSKILRQNKEAYDREVNRLRNELHNSRAEAEHLRNRSINGCPIS